MNWYAFDADKTDAKVRAVLEIQAHVPNGAPENIVRTIAENCKPLKSDSQGFDEQIHNII